MNDVFVKVFNFEHEYFISNDLDDLPCIVYDAINRVFNNINKDVIKVIFDCKTLECDVVEFDGAHMVHWKCVPSNIDQLGNIKYWEVCHIC